MLPSWSWWITPSGGPYPNPRRLWTVLLEAPLPAHLGNGAICTALAELLTSGGWRMAACALLLGFAQQAGKRDALGRATYPDWQIAWRLVITAVPIVVWWGLSA